MTRPTVDRRLSREVMRDQERLLVAMRHYLEPATGARIEDALVVVRRPTFTALVGTSLAAAIVIGLLTAVLTGLWVLAVMVGIGVLHLCSLLALVLHKRLFEVAVVCVTTTEYVLVRCAARDITQAAIAERLPRRTAMPFNRACSAGMRGEVLPFITACGPYSNWYYYERSDDSAAAESGASIHPMVAAE